jgi:hypothetical protein
MAKYRIIIAGGREFNDWDLLKMKVSYYILSLDPKEVEIVSGGCRGADKLGERYAEEYGYPVQPFYVSREDWDKFGKAAGPIRNGKMAKYSTHLIAFWHDGDDGTENVIKQSKRAGLKIKIVRY